MLPTFETLIAPTSREAFLREYMGRSALHTTGSKDRFGDLESWESVNHLLVYGALTYPRIRLMMGEKDIPAGAYFRTGQNGFPRLLGPELLALQRRGATLTIGAMEQLHEAVSRLCRDLEMTLHVPVRADLYANWKGMAPRVPDWNDHEALILQIDGAKEWHLYRPTVPSPTAYTQASEPTGEPAWHGVLQRGDFLYIPRGWWYCDHPPSDASLYIVLSFRNPTGLDVLRSLFDRLDSLEAMRADYPRFGSPQSQRFFLTTLLAELSNQCAKPGILLGALKDMRAASEPRLCFDLRRGESPRASWSGDLAVVPLVRFPSGDTARRLPREDGVVLDHEGRTLRFHENVASIFECLRDGAAPTIDQILECSDDTNRERLIESLWELEAQGIVALVARSV